MTCGTVSHMQVLQHYAFALARVSDGSCVGLLPGEQVRYEPKNIDLASRRLPPDHWKTTKSGVVVNVWKDEKGVKLCTVLWS